MRKFLSIRSYLALSLGGIMALTVAAVALPHDPYIRAQSLQGTMMEGARYNYERLHFDQTPIDVAFLGQSRTMAAVHPHVLEQELARRGHPLRVVNFSIPAAGLDIQLAQARELLRTHPETRLLVISIVERFPRDGHQAFGDAASVSDILASPVLINRNLPSSIMRLPMRQIKLFLASAMPDAFGYDARFDPRRYPGANASSDQTSTWHTTPAENPLASPEHARALAEEAVRRNAEMNPPILPASMADIEFGVSRQSIDSMVALARANGTQVAFLFLPFYNGWDAPEEAAWLQQRGPVWSVTSLRNDPRNYIDAAHASPGSVPLVSAELADRIVAHLAAGPDTGSGQQD